jgi:two-component system CheB/CheR fusion protein
MPPARRERWFVTDSGYCCPVKEIREMCIFSIHSAVKDPPFSKLDLISCRNLLIYLEPSLQERLVRTFHYALAPGGYLFLGTSENVTRQNKLFVTLDQKHRIFQRRDVPASLPGVGIAGSGFTRTRRRSIDDACREWPRKKRTPAHGETCTGLRCRRRQL